MSTDKPDDAAADAPIIAIALAAAKTLMDKLAAIMAADPTIDPAITSLLTTINQRHLDLLHALQHLRQSRFQLEDECQALRLLSAILVKRLGGRVEMGAEDFCAELRARSKLRIEEDPNAPRGTLIYETCTDPTCQNHPHSIERVIQKESTLPTPGSLFPRERGH